MCYAKHLNRVHRVPLSLYKRKPAILLVACLTLLLSSATINCGVKELPYYIHKQPDSSIEIRVEEASLNAIYDIGSNSILCYIGNTTIEFDLLAVSSSEVSNSYLEDVPLKISPIIAPGDGVADFFAAVEENSKTNELCIVLFIDGDWADVVKGQLYCHFVDYTDRNGIKETVRNVNLDEAINDIYFVKFKFSISSFLKGAWQGYPLGPLVAITNIEGTPREVQKKLTRAEIEGKQVYVMVFGTAG